MAYTTINKHTDYFNTKLYTGNGTAIGSGGQAITGVGFQPDWVWIKERSSTSPHKLLDSVRGVTKELETNANNTQSTEAESLTAFGTDGFTVGSNGAVNQNSQTYAAWNWKAGTTGSGTTTGSGYGKAYSYSVNTTAGFSIITYKGNGTAGHTIPHHLGAVPKMIIVKCIESVHNWQVLHQGLATNSGTKNLELNSTSAVLTDSTTWNDTAPTSTVFTLGSTNPTNQSSSNYNFIAYCFAEKTGFSKFGSYTGNGSTNGTFVYTGFKPAWLMIKQINTTGNWALSDNKRNNTGGGNFVSHTLAANLNNNESHFGGGSGNKQDYLSNGFKIRDTGGYANTSGGTYIYMAFAEAPLVGSNNIPCTAR